MKTKRYNTQAKGAQEVYGGMRATACRFDEKTHEKIRKLAAKDNVSFAEKVREIVEWGLLELEITGLGDRKL